MVWLHGLQPSWSITAGDDMGLVSSGAQRTSDIPLMSFAAVRFAGAGNVGELSGSDCAVQQTSRSVIG